MSLLFGLLCLTFSANAQLVDSILGQPRNIAQVYLRPYRIIDYQKDRVVHNIEPGIHETALFENDTCIKFYWAVTPDRMDYFKGMLIGAGYKESADGGFVKDSLELSARELSSGKATLFIASLSKDLTGNRDRSGKLIVDKKKVMENEQMPRLQQAILAEDRDTTKVKKPKDPRKHWVGGSYGKTSILGWD